MGRAPCCDKANVKKGPWSPEEDLQLKQYIEKYGTGGNWIALPQKAGLRRCGKSCRLRWLNYLRPNIKHGEFSAEEDRIICTLFATIGSRWSIIAAQLPGRTDNDIKNYWNTKLKKKLVGMVSTTPQIKKTQSFSPPSYQNASFQQLSSLYRSHSSISNNIICNPTTDKYYYEPSSSAIPFDCSNAISGCLVTNPFGSQGSLGGSIDQCYATLKSNHLPVDQAGSCSSSDGGYTVKMGLESSLIGSHGFEESQKLMMHYNNGHSFGKDAIDYELEDVKQLISSSNGWLLNVEEQKKKKKKKTEAEEKYCYYY